MKQSTTEQTSMSVANRRHIGVDSIAVERIPLGAPGDYKPCVAKLPNGELLVSAYRPNIPAGNDPVPGLREDYGRVLEPPLLFQSLDGGCTWSPPRILNLAGKEPYLSVTAHGTVFITTHLVVRNVLNKDGQTYGLIHRSEDGGRTWRSIRAETESERRAESPGYYSLTNRNVLELSDGSLIVAISGVGPEANAMWRSTDEGSTWSERYPARIEDQPEDYTWSTMGEAVLWQARSGKLYFILRVDNRGWPRIDGKPLELSPTELHDNYDRMILYASTDLGRSWKRVRDFGTYGYMYPSMLRLQDGRLLLTFTQRAPNRPKGLRAILGTESEDGFDLDFEHDVIMIDERTPLEQKSGGGFGCTVQLDDGTLVSSYSYRSALEPFAGEDRELHLEIARWHAPS